MQERDKLKVALFGSVESSKIVMEEMLGLGVIPNMVFSLDETVSDVVSGYVALHEYARENNVPCCIFKKINDNRCVERLKHISPDYTFVIGLSQIAGEEILKCSKKGTVGFHPTPLPKMRGRAAIVWQILLGIRKTKCSMFFLNSGMDSGDIIDQEEYEINEGDYAKDVHDSVSAAIHRLSKRVLQNMLSDNIHATPQDENEATYLLKRSPTDGKIDWRASVYSIETLIRAVSSPYPGAFTYYDQKNLMRIWRATAVTNQKYIGMPGQIAEISDSYIYVIGIDGMVRIEEYEIEPLARIIAGHKLG